MNFIVHHDEEAFRRAQVSANSGKWWNTVPPFLAFYSYIPSAHYLNIFDPSHLSSVHQVGSSGPTSKKQL